MRNQSKRGKMAPGSALEPIYTPESLKIDIKTFSTNIRDAKELRVRSEDGSEFNVPEPLLKLLKRGASLLANGAVFVIRPYENYVTQQQAADFLDSTKNVINQYIDDGKIQVGRDGDKKLISLDDLIKYKELKDRLNFLKFKNGSKEFARLIAQEYGDDGFPVTENEISDLQSKFNSFNGIC